MNLSRNWLREFVRVDANDKEFADAMTLSGSKVEVTEYLGEEIKNVVVGKVRSIVRHENSDHMWVCQIDIGEAEPVQIVTGAQNVKEGDLVPAALHNSYLPGGVHITKGKLRGELSCGMLCSLKELNLDTRDFPDAIEDGIWIITEPDAEIGMDIRKLIGADDSVVEFEITPNRPDCLSVIGLAREAAATFRTALSLHEPVVKGGGDGSLLELLDVETPDADLCPRYSARMVRNVKIAPSPRWMRERLRAAGVRPINNIVDITNYVMLEYGQPMHAFDYRYVKGGKIIVRRAKNSEQLTTLDGTVRELTDNMLVIADETRAVGLAGVMGGENSEIVADTVDVVFESANFNGTCIRKTALALGMRTDASAKFEKGLDPMNTVPALNRACELVEMLGAGEVLDGMIDILNHVPQPTVLDLRPDKINELLGTKIATSEMVEILKSLDFTVDGETVTVPSWRADVVHYSDLAEEVARFHGYNNIPVTLMRGQTTLGGYSQSEQLERTLGTMCRSLGCSEIITYSFISPTYYDKIRLAADSPLRNSLRICNPLGEDTSIMRTTTLPSMLEIISRNYNYHNKSVRLYEVGRTYFPREDGMADEPRVLTLGAYGAMDFFALKGMVAALLQTIRADEAIYESVQDNPSYHPGRCASITVNGTKIGVFGQIHPLVAENYGIDTEVYCAELSFDALSAVQGGSPVYTPLPKFPAVTRDLALLCDDTLTIAQLEGCIKRAGGTLLRKVTLFDIYRGTGVAEGKKSVAFSLELRADDRTLTDEDSTAVISKVLTALESEWNAILR